jgi:translation initiation factor 3 subunit J
LQDSWDAEEEEEKKDEEKTTPVKAKPKKTLQQKLAEKEVIPD